VSYAYGLAVARDATGDDSAVVAVSGDGALTGGLAYEALNNFGHLLPRRRIIEGGLILLGVLIAILSSIGIIPGLVAKVDARTSLELSSLITVLSVAIAVAFLAGVCYAGVAISSQTQLQEDLPEDVRGRVFGVLFTLISVASFVPVIVVGPIADAVGTPKRPARRGDPPHGCRGPLGHHPRDDRGTARRPTGACGALPAHAELAALADGQAARPVGGHRRRNSGRPRVRPAAP
jgi:MFS family permease